MWVVIVIVGLLNYVYLIGCGLVVLFVVYFARFLLCFGYVAWVIGFNCDLVY